MKDYNCPDCGRPDNCDGCPRVNSKNNKHLEVPKYFPDSIIWPQEQYIPSCCRNCSNHPSNGGGGICNCALPTYESNTGVNYYW